MDFLSPGGVNEMLFAAADKGYQAFTSRLTNTKYPILGVRIPQLQAMAKRILKGDYSAFLSIPFTYFEHHLLRGMVCAMNKEGEGEHLSLFAEYIPFIDDWEGVDLIASRYTNASESYFNALTEYLSDCREYAVRFALVALLSNFAATPRAGEIVRLVRSLTPCGYMEKFARAAKSKTRNLPAQPPRKILRLTWRVKNPAWAAISRFPLPPSAARQPRLAAITSSWARHGCSPSSTLRKNPPSSPTLATPRKIPPPA